MEDRWQGSGLRDLPDQRGQEPFVPWRLNVENFYANALTRVGETNNTTFEIVPVDRYGTQGTSAKADMDWPDNSKPKAGATASRTLLNVGDEVTFTSASSKNTAEVAWFLPGSSKEHATGKSVTVTYDKEGVYDVEITAKNKSGEATATLKGRLSSPRMSWTLCCSLKALRSAPTVHERQREA